MSLIAPSVDGAAVVPLGPLGRGHRTARARARQGPFGGAWAEAGLYLPEFVPPNATLHFDFEQWAAYAEPAGLGRGGVISTPDAMLAVARLSPRTIQNAAGGIDLLGSSIIARDYSAAGLARGVPIEPLSINWLLRSGDLGHAVWSKGGVSVPAGPVAPDGVQAWGRITENSAGGQHYIGQSIGAVAVGDVLTTTVDVRATGIGAARHVFVTAYGEGYGVFNPATGAVVSSTGVTASVEPRGGGAFRVRTTVVKSNTNGTIFVGLWNPAGNNVYVGDGVSCVDAWGAQTEKRSTPTSYMPTVDTTAARYADAISTPWGTWGNAAAGTIRAAYTVPFVTNAGREVFSISTADGAAQMTLRATTGGGNIAWFITSGGVEIGRIEAGAAVAGQREVIACSYGPAGFKISRNGGPTSTNGTLTVPVPSPATLWLGRGYGGVELQGWLEDLSYQPGQLSSGDLQAWAAAA